MKIIIPLREVSEQIEIVFASPTWESNVVAISIVNKHDRSVEAEAIMFRDEARELMRALDIASQPYEDSV